MRLPDYRRSARHERQATGRHYGCTQLGELMTDSKSAARAFLVCNLRLALGRLSRAVHKDAPAGDRTNKEIRAAYERQEAELFRSLENTRRILALLRDEPTTTLTENNPIN